MRRTVWASEDPFRRAFRPSPAVLAAALVLGLPRSAEASPEGSAVKAPWRAPAANVLGLSLSVQAPLSLDKKAPFGAGLVYTRQYFITPRTALGITAGLRVFPTDPLHLAFGYGLTFQHYLGRGTVGETPYGFYLTYGLLLQMNWLAEQDGTATGHDTLLALGYDFPAGRVLPTLQAGYHLTQVRNFDQDTLWWPYTELLFAVRF